MNFLSGVGVLDFGALDTEDDNDLVSFLNSKKPQSDGLSHPRTRITPNQRQNSAPDWVEKPRSVDLAIGYIMGRSSAQELQKRGDGDRLYDTIQHQSIARELGNSLSDNGVAIVDSRSFKGDFNDFRNKLNPLSLFISPIEGTPLFIISRKPDYKLDDFARSVKTDT